MDCEMNMRNCLYSVKWQSGYHGKVNYRSAW